MLSLWRKFQFFDREQLLEPDGRTPMGVFSDFSPTCSASGRGHVLFGDGDGRIHIINRDFEKESFIAYDGAVIALQQLKRQNILVSIGHDNSDGEPNVSVKIWRRDQGADEAGTPVLARTLKLFSPKLAHCSVTSFSALEDLSQVAIGLGTGAVLLLNGNLLRDRNVVPNILVQSGGPCVSAVRFREEAGPRTPCCLFVATTETVTTFFTKTNEKQVPKTVVEPEKGSEIGCAALTEEGGFCTARKEAVFFYDANDIGMCFGFDGDKKEVGFFNSYLYLITINRKDIAKPNTLAVYDLKNKFVAFNSKFDEISQVVCEWGSIFVATKKRQVFQLTEKDRTTKMDTLFKKNFYSIAISLANSQDCDKAYVMNIFQRYGDHLYSKGDFDNAIQQYIETINYVEPSYVIQKFLDAQRILNLTRYLEALHHRSQANTEHTTLLLNCYTKLKDVSKLDEFIKNTKLKFDVPTAIKVCRQAGYCGHALHLARVHHKHKLFLKVLLEDEGDIERAVLYIASLPFADAKQFTMTFGHRLMAEQPEAMTELLKRLCTSFVPSPLEDEEEFKQKSQQTSSAAEEASSMEAQRVKPEDCIHFFVGRPRQLQAFLEHCTSQTRCGPAVYNTLLELMLRNNSSQEEEKVEGKPQGGHSLAGKIMNLLKSGDNQYDEATALVLTRQHGFDKGVLYLYEKMGLYHEIVQIHMERGKHSQIIKACRKYGDRDKNLWVQALGYFAQTKETCESEIQDILEHIERHNLMPPLRVVQILSQNTTKPLSCIKDYIVNALRNETSIIVADQREIKQYKQDTAKMRKEIHKLRTKPTTFQGTKCHACGSGLALPAVHFLCLHSYHQRCIVDNDRECPKCADEFRKIREIKEHMVASALKHDDFFQQLDDSNDGFATVAEYFGRGLFAPPPSSSESSGSSSSRHRNN